MLERKQEAAWVKWALLLAVLTYTLFFSAYQIQRHRTFQTYVDLMSLEQTIWNTIHGRFMRSTVYPPTGELIHEFDARATESRLGAHVQPLLLLLALPYALFPRPEVLLVLMCGASALGALPLFSLARRRLGSAEWALACAVGYLLLPAVQTTTAWDIHGTSFLPPLLLAALDAAERKQRGWWWICALLAMSCREDAPFLVGWALFWLAPRSERRQAALMLGVGFILSLLNFTVIIPHYATAGTPYLAQFFPPGVELSRAGLRALLTHPPFWSALAGNVLTYNLLLGLPLLFLFWWHWPTLLAIAPTLIINSLSWKPSVHVPSYSHYSAPIVPWIVLGALEGGLRVQRWFQVRYPRWHWRIVLGEALGVSVLAAQFATGYTPLSRVFLWPRATGQELALHAVLAELPPAAPAALEMQLSAHAAQRETVRIFPDQRDAEWLALNVWFGKDPYGDWSFTALEALLDDARWETVAAAEGVLLLRHGVGPPQGIGQAFVPTADIPLQLLTVEFGEGAAALRLLGLRVFPRAAGHFYLCTDWVMGSEADALPWADVGSVRLEGISVKPLDAMPLLLRMPERPSVVRDCTYLVTSSVGRTLPLRLAVYAPDGSPYLPTLLDPGVWSERVQVQDAMLVIDYPGW